MRPCIEALIIVAAMLTGCQQHLAPQEFVPQYEAAATITEECNGFKMILLYVSPEYMAATQGGSAATPGLIDSLKTAYSKAHYFRISFRPSLFGDHKMKSDSETFPNDIPAIQAAMGQQLLSIKNEFSERIYMGNKDGDKVKALSVSFQRGILTGASNTLLVVFPKRFEGHSVDLDDYELVIEDLGLNFGTVRRKLASPKEIRLKVAA